MFSAWKASLSGITLYGAPLAIPLDFQVERQNRFVNTYIGANYAIWTFPYEYDVYIGMDIGSTNFRSELTFSYTSLDGTDVDDVSIYDYNSFTFKFMVGGTYYLSNSFSLGLSIIFKSVQPFDTSDQRLDIDPPDQIKPFFIPEEINASGIQLNLYLGYYF